VALGWEDAIKKRSGIAVNMILDPFHLLISNDFGARLDLLSDFKSGADIWQSPHPVFQLETFDAFKLIGVVGQQYHIFSVTTQHPLDFVLWQGARRAKSVAYGLYVRIRASQQRR